MKTTFFCLLLVFASGVALSQVDTIYTRKNQHIPCKIIEINEYDIKYSLADMRDGPIMVVNRNDVRSYRLANGFTETLTPDELLVENVYKDILKNRSVIKVSPFSLINNQISIAYEQVIKVGMNLDVEVGYINNSMNDSPIMQNPISSGTNGQPAYYTGAYLKPGVKFFLGQDYTVRGIKYAHPLKGRYIRLDMAFSYLGFKDVSRFNYNGQQPNQPATVTTNINTIAYGGFVNYGRQFILGNILTMEYFIGVGFTGQSDSYSNPSYLTTNPYYPQWGYYGYNGEAKNVSNYHGFQRIPDVGLSFTGGFRIGYIIPDKPKRQPTASSK